MYELQFLISDTYWNLQEENICDRKGHFKKDYQNIESFVTETQQTSKIKKNVKKCLSEASFSVDAILQSDRSQFPPRRWKKLVSKWRRKPSSNILTGITHPIEVGMREVSSRERERGRECVWERERGREEEIDIERMRESVREEKRGQKIEWERRYSTHTFLFLSLQTSSYFPLFWNVITTHDNNSKYNVSHIKF